MKNRFSIFVLTVLLGFAFAKAQQRGARIGYVNMEYILESVPEYQEASRQLEQKMSKWKQEIDAMNTEIEQMETALKNERVLLTKELIEEKEEDIAIKQQELADYQQKRFGAQGDFVLQKQQLIQPVQDQVFNEVQKIGQQKKYDYIVDSSDLAMLYSEDRHDISDVILKAIGRTGKKKEAQKKELSRTEQIEKEREGAFISVADREKIEEKEEELQERQEKRQEIVDEREAEKAERIRVRDSIRAAKAAAYKERREKLMAERQRKRDSIAAARKAAKEEREEELRKKREEREQNNGSSSGGN
ncbi:OmpH family outer membrane protein [Nonlabens xiamenensis]|uniref:OmpH family outer membrane protein n=1 Tax=Nonlabens xiamenensis TaxID=2341043 RepID=UPI000F612CB6|nr:OmpH family outer membrane protein [Nonlabens xiamenensis]